MNTTLQNATIVAEPGSPEVTITRDFAAPAEKVWRAMSEPDLIARWMGPDSLTTEIEEYDARHGGVWRMIHRSPDGQEFAFRGTFHGEQTAELSMRTFEWEGMPGHVSLEWQTIEDLGDGTSRVHGHSVFMSVEDRDGMVESGMEIGVQEGFRKLDAVLAEL